MAASGVPPPFLSQKVSKNLKSKMKQNHTRVDDYSAMPEPRMHVNRYRHANRQGFQPVFMRLLAIWRFEPAFW